MPTYNYTITFQDRGGNAAVMEGSVVGTDQANAITKIQGIAEALNSVDPIGDGSEPPLTLGVITNVNISIPVSTTGWDIRTSADEAAENQKGGRFIWQTASGFPTRQTIPTFNEAYKLPSGYLIDRADSPAMFAFVTTASILGGASDKRGSDITAPLDAYFTYGGRPAYK